MPRIPRGLLKRFPLIETTDLAAARQRTSEFWPEHDSRIIGPESYAVAICRVLLGEVAMTFTSCTARLCVLPKAPSKGACLIMPLEGFVEIETDEGFYRASPGRPLLRAPAWVRRFEASPTRCLLVDVPKMALLAGAGSPPRDAPLEHRILSQQDAAGLQRAVISLAQAANKSLKLRAIQLQPATERTRQLPRTIRQMESRLIEALASHCVVRKPGAAVTVASGSDAVEAVLTHYATSGLPIEELAKFAGLSVRSLQRECASRGYTPVAFMRCVQLDRARDLLSTAGPDDSVAAIAMAAGFMHLGRFSSHYQKRFGERPSATLARASMSRPQGPPG